LTIKFESPKLEAAFVARLLRAAPQLRQLTFDVYFPEDAQWVLSGAFTRERSFMRPFHPQLRHLAITSEHSPMGVRVSGGCGVRLRQRHFPRLRRLTVEDEDYPVVWCVVRPARKTYLSNSV
jgi:hypothetical protein